MALLKREYIDLDSLSHDPNIERDMFEKEIRDRYMNRNIEIYKIGCTIEIDIDNGNQTGEAYVDFWE